MQDHQKESKRGHKEIQPRNHTRNDHDIKSLKKVRRTQKLGQYRLITLLDKQSREIHDQIRSQNEYRNSTPSYMTVNRVP